MFATAPLKPDRDFTQEWSARPAWRQAIQPNPGSASDIELQVKAALPVGVIERVKIENHTGPGHFVVNINLTRVITIEEEALVNAAIDAARAAGTTYSVHYMVVYKMSTSMFLNNI